MKIVVSGGSGFIGRPLVGRLLSRGDVAVLTRDRSHVHAGRPLEWHPPAKGDWTREVADADVVINLAGESIGAGRWTELRKRRLVSSRLDATRAVVDAMKENTAKRHTFISASAVGYYGPRGDERVDENAAAGGGFLADLAKQWEEAACGAEPFARVVIGRFGIVLGKDGGALAKMLPPFRFGIGGPIASGQQWMSWIDREDLLRFVEWSIDRGETRGVYNITAPEPVRNREFTRELGRALHRPAFLPVPGFALRFLFGEMADEALLSGQRVVPSRALAEGFTFRYRTLEESLRQIFAS